MKNSSTYERKFKTLLGKMKKAYSPEEPQLPTDPTEELLWSVVLEDANEGTAKVALSRLTGHFVDHNELRVSRPDEIVDVLPNTLSDARDRAGRIIRSLQAAFDRFDALEMTELRDFPKREARGFLSAIPGMTPFVEGRVCLFSLGIHAIPVDQALVKLLVERDAVHEETDPRDTQGFLERVVPAKDAVKVTLLLEALRQTPEKIKATVSVKKKPAAKTEAAAKPAKAIKKSKKAVRKSRTSRRAAKK